MGFLSGKESASACRLQVITLDHVIEGSADISGQNLIRSPSSPT
jgi:hypothetical protein